MERFILNDLIKWKNSKYRKPLILKGVRQVGKTWILKEFGSRYYENIAYFNFDENPEYRQFFQTTKDINRILQNLILISGYKIVPEKTLIIFDEVQDAPEVINSLKYFYEKTQLSKKLLQEEESLDTQDLVILSELGRIVYTADYFNAENQTLANAYIIIRDEDGNLSLVIKSSHMVWNEDRWTTDNAEAYRFDEKNIVSCLNNIPDNIILSEPPANFQKNLSSVDEMRISEAKEFIAALKKNGLPYYEALSKYHRRFSFPFTIFIVLFFSISLGGKFKKNILLMSILFSLGIATLFYVTEMVTMLSAKWEYISPLAGAWTPIFIFSIFLPFLIILCNSG